MSKIEALESKLKTNNKLFQALQKDWEASSQEAGQLREKVHVFLCELYRYLGV